MSYTPPSPCLTQAMSTFDPDATLDPAAIAADQQQLIDAARVAAAKKRKTTEDGGAERQQQKKRRTDKEEDSKDVVILSATRPCKGCDDAGCCREPVPEVQCPFFLCNLCFCRNRCSHPTLCYPCYRKVCKCLPCEASRTRTSLRATVAKYLTGNGALAAQRAQKVMEPFFQMPTISGSDLDVQVCTEASRECVNKLNALNVARLYLYNKELFGRLSELDRRQLGCLPDVVDK